MSEKGICIIGHLTKDLIRNNNNERYEPGGTVFYMATALNAFTENFQVITSHGQEDKGFFSSFLSTLSDTKVILQKESLIFENVYGKNTNQRTQFVHSGAYPFHSRDLEGIDPSVCHLGPLLSIDFSLEIIKLISKKSILSLDTQGFMRYVDDKKVVLREWSEMKAILSLTTILKANLDEFNCLMPGESLESGSKKLLDFGVKEVIVTLGDQGSIVATQDNFYEIPAIKPKNQCDPTGCGDTYMAGYLFQRILNKKDIEYAARFASAMASLKLESVGPFRGTPEELNEMIQMN